MWGQDRKRGHGIHRQRLWQRCRKGLSKERDPAFRLRPRREETAFETFVGLGNEELWSTEATTTIRGIDLMIEELLHVVNRQQVLAIHGDDDGVPYLGNKDLRLVSTGDVGENVIGRTLGLYRTSKSEVAKILEYMRFGKRA